MPRAPNPDVRDRLHHAGGKLVQGTSFGGASVQDITAAAGVPKGSFYNYFESKDAFAVELLETYWQAIDDAYGPILNAPNTAPLEAIRDFFDGLIAYHAERRFTPGCLIGNLALELAATNPMVRASLRGLFSRWTQALVGRLRDAAGQGALAEGQDLNELAAALIDAFEGAVLRSKVDQDKAALRRFSELVLPRLLL